MSESFANMMSGYRDWLMVGASIMPLAICSPALAADDEAVVLDDVVISANRTETSIKSVGSSVTVITAKDIEKSQTFLLAEILDRAVGVNVSQYYGHGAAGPLTSSMRGANFNQVKMLVDGVRVTSLNNMSAADVERIEILKGSQSTLYGSDAMGGVISITTKSGKSSKKLISGSMYTEFETLNGYKVGGSLNGRYKDVYYGMNFMQYDTDGTDMSAGNNRTFGKYGENDGYENVSINTHIGADLLRDVGILDKLNVEYIMRFRDAESEVDTANALMAPTDSFSVYKDNLSLHKLQTRADLLNGMLSNELSASYSTSSRDHFVGGVRNTNSYADTEVGTVKYEYKGVLKPIENHTLVFGSDYEKLSVRNGDFQRSQQGFYGNYQLEFLDKSLTLTMGTRYDKVDSVDGQLTYRSTLGYHIDSTGTRFHTSYGTGFRAANADELAWTPGGDLDPEKSRSYDFGVEQSLFEDRIIIDVTAFNTRVQDQITWDAVAYSYDNISSSRTFGVESSLYAEVTPEVSLDVNYTYQEPKDISSDSLLTWRPKHSGSAMISYDSKAIDGLSTWVRGTYKGNARDISGDIDGFVKYDVGASYDWDHGITFYGNIDNVLDKNYETKYTFAMPGIVGTIGARMNF